MQLIRRNESPMIRRNTQLRSLFIEYPRSEGNSHISAALSNHHSSSERFNLTVTNTSTRGIVVKLPSEVTGMFDLNIHDGKHRISKRIALQ